MKIKNTDTIHQGPLKVIVYAQSGVGKTSLAKTLPHDRVLVLSAESGLLPLSGTSIRYIDLSKNDEEQVLPTAEGRIKRLNEVLTYVTKPEVTKDFDWLVFDSATEIGELYADYWKAKITDKAKAFEVWGNIAKDQITLLKTLRDMAHYNVVITCLEEYEKDDASRFFYGPKMPGNLGKEFMVPAFDLVFRMISDDKGVRYLQTNAMANMRCKDRSGKLQPQEPADLGKIASKIRGVEGDKNEKENSKKESK